MRQNIFQFILTKGSQLLARLISAFKRERPHRPHSALANGAVRGVSIPTPSEMLKQCAAGLYKLLNILLPRHLLFKFCVSPYKMGVFFFQCFDALFDQVKLSPEYRNMLLQNGSALHVAEGGNQPSNN